MNSIKELISVLGEYKIKSVIYRVLNHNFIKLYTSKEILFEKIQMKCYFDVEFQRQFIGSINKFCYYEIETILQDHEEFYNEKTQYDKKKRYNQLEEWKKQYEKEEIKKKEMFLNPFRLEFMIKKPYGLF